MHSGEERKMRHGVVLAASYMGGVMRSMYIGVVMAAGPKGEVTNRSVAWV